MMVLVTTRRQRLASDVLLGLFVIVGSAATAADLPKSAVTQATDALGDPLPFGAVMRLGTTRLRYQGGYGLVFSADGKSLYSPGYGGIKVSDVATGKLQGSFKDSDEPWNCLALSPDGKTLAAAGSISKKSICLWAVATRDLKAAWEGHIDGAHSVTFSPDGKLLASGGCDQDGTIRVWDVATKAELHKWVTDSTIRGYIKSVAFSPDGRSVAAASEQGNNPAADTVRLWELKEGKEIWQTKGPGQVCSLQFTGDGKALYAGGYKGAVWVFDAGDGKRKDSPKLLGREIVLVDGGKTLIASSPDEGMTNVRVCDSKTGELVRKLVGHGSSIVSLAITRDERTLAAAANDGNIIIWDLRTGERCHKLPGHEYTVGGIAYSPDGKLLATFGADYTVRLWDAQTGKELNCLDAGPKDDFAGSGTHFQSWAQALVFSPTGRILAAPGPRGTVYLWNPVTGQELGRLEGHKRMPCCLAFSRDGKTLASGDDNGRILLWNVDDKKETSRLEVQDKARPRNYGVMRLAIAPDGKTLAAGCVNEDLRLWDLEKRSLRATYRFWATDGLTFCDGGLLLAAGDLGRRPGASAVVRFVLPDTGDEYRRLTLLAPDGPHESLPMGDHVTFALSPDERTVAAVGDGDTNLHWYERATNREIGRISGLAAGTQCVAFSPDGRFVAVGGRDKTVLVWDLFRAVRGTGVGLEPPDQKRARELWAALADPDPAIAYKSMGAPGHAPEPQWTSASTTSDLLQGKKATIEKLIASLDDDAFDVREAAVQDLVALGPEALHPVVVAIKKPTSAEAETRLRAVVAKLRDPVPLADTLLHLRAVGLLEAIKLDEAHTILESLAGGAPGASLTLAAKAALQRLRKRGHLSRD